MKIKSILSLSAFAFTASLFPFSAIHAEDVAYEQTDLYKSMKVMNDAHRDIRRSLRSASVANKPQYLQWMQTIKDEALKGSKLAPFIFKDLSEEEKETQMKAYQKEMAKFIEAVDEATAAIEAEDFEKASTLLADLNKLKSAGHRKFKPQDQ